MSRVLVQGYDWIDCYYTWHVIFSFHICAGDSANSKDSCQGDSGGPLIVSENNRYKAHIQNMTACNNDTLNITYNTRFSQIGVVSYGSECPSNGVYARVTEVKHWNQFIAKGAMDSNCNEEIPYQPGDILYI